MSYTGFDSTLQLFFITSTGENAGYLTITGPAGQQFIFKSTMILDNNEKVIFCFIKEIQQSTLPRVPCAATLPPETEICYLSALMEEENIISSTVDK